MIVPLENEVENIEVTTEDVEREARSMGWVPEEEFKGNKEKWVSAEDFVDRGKHLLPILNKNNKRLQQDLLTRDTKIDNLNKQLMEVREQLDTLSQHYTKATARAVEASKKELITQLREARENRDEEAEQQILGQLDDIRETQRQVKIEEDKKKTPTQPDPSKENYNDNLDPGVKAFIDENPWFNDDKKKAKQFIRIVEDLRDEGDTRVGKPLLDAALEVFNGQQEGLNPRPSKVEGGNGRNGSRGSSKGYNSLPKEAKEACDADNDKLVGPTKKFKTVDEWRDFYAKEFYAYE